MTPEQMSLDAFEALAYRTNVTLIHNKGTKMPPKFPRGELLCESHDGSRAYSYDPIRVLAWLHANKLIEITLTSPPNPQATDGSSGSTNAKNDDQ